MTEPVLLTVTDSIARITFNRPATLNALDKHMIAALAQITEEIKANDAVRVVLLSGQGNAFMAGGDIQFFYDNLDGISDKAKAIITDLHTAIHNLCSMPKPVVACVHGAIAGAGISVMLAADLVLAAESTKFTLAYSGIGISPDGGATYHLSKIVGKQKAMELLLLSERFDAATAHKLGLLNWVVNDTDLNVATEKLLMQLATGPSVAYAQIKELVQQSFTNNLEQQLDAEAKAFVHCTTTEDFKRGVSGFIEKHKPEFYGS